MERPLERRNAARTAVVWDAVHALLEGPDRRGAAGPRHRRRHRRLRRPGRRARPPDHRRRPQPRRPRRAGPPRRRAGRRRPGHRASRATWAPSRELAPEGGVDLVLCHGVLGLVDDPAGALADDRLGAASRRGRSRWWSASATPPSWPAPWPATSPRPARCSPPTGRRPSGAASAASPPRSCRPARRRRLHHQQRPRRPGLHRPGALLAARPRARRRCGPARARAGGGRPPGVPHRRQPAPRRSPPADPPPPGSGDPATGGAAMTRSDPSPRLPDPARRHGRLLRLGGHPRPPRPRRRAGDRGRGAPRGGAGGQLPRPDATASARRCR